MKTLLLWILLTGPLGATTYYVKNGGNNSSAGTSYGAAWLTVGKVLNTGSPVTSGDTVWIAPGVYRETSISVAISPSSEVQVNCDVTGTHTSGAPGECQITAYATNDTTIAATTVILTLNAKDFLTFQDLVFVGGAVGGSGAGTIVDASNATSTNITFRRCVFINQQTTTGNQIDISTPVTTALHWVIDACRFLSFNGNAAIGITLSSNDGSEHDADILVKNSTFMGDGVNGASSAYIILVTNTDWGGGGLSVYDCFFMGHKRAVSMSDFGSTSFPTKVYGSVIIQGYDTTALACNWCSHTGTPVFLEDYNIIYSPTPRAVGNGSWTNGTHTVTDGSIAPLFYLGQERLWSSVSRPFGMPTASSPWSAFNSQSGSPTVDILNATRPSPAAAGALEYAAPAAAGGQRSFATAH